jgi:hypothetical protein
LKQRLSQRSGLLPGGPSGFSGFPNGVDGSAGGSFPGGGETGGNGPTNGPNSNANSRDHYVKNSNKQQKSDTVTHSSGIQRPKQSAASRAGALTGNAGGDDGGTGNHFGREPTLTEQRQMFRKRRKSTEF